jgi:hypothetical protein
MLTHKIYYLLKPFIPRELQIFLRRKVVLWKRGLYKHVWPIDENASRPPKNWSGWPEGKQFALVLTHDVETAAGQEKCLQLIDLERKFGFGSAFNFVPKRYDVSSELRSYLTQNGFEVGVHGLYHDGKYYRSEKIFLKRANQINYYLKEWNAVGFRSPSMQRNLEWIHNLDIEYDASTFDTDPFEPHPDGVGTIFPFWVPRNNVGNSSNPSNPTNSSNLQPETALANGFVELPYTLPQDFTLFILMKEKGIDIWKKKLDWVAESGGMALSITHPDYMNGKKKKCGIEEYPMEFYQEFLDYMKSEYEGQYWNPSPKEMAHFWKEKMVIPQSSKSMKEF